MGVLGLVLTVGVVRTNASAPQPGCDTFKGQLTETTVPSANDPLGRTIGVLSSGPCTSTSACSAQGVDTNQVAFWYDVDASGFPTLALAQSLDSAESGGTRTV